MEENNFIFFKKIEKILEDNYFFGFTAKHIKNTTKIVYTYQNIKYPKIIIKILTTKINPHKQIVLGVKFDGKKINEWNDFINALNNIYIYNKKKYGNAKKNQCNHHHN